jgi:ElaB/YqjD/DUF883 family membrane-anchored ribosome-binding protein
MPDEQATPQGEQGQTSASEAWQEVGQHFQALGESLAAAFKTAWQSETNRQHLQELQANLEAMADKVSQTAKEVAASPEVQQVRGGVEKVAQSVQAAGQQTMAEVQPRLLDALHQVKAEIEKIINRLEEETPPADESK